MPSMVVYSPKVDLDLKTIPPKYLGIDIFSSGRRIGLWEWVYKLPRNTHSKNKFTIGEMENNNLFMRLSNVFSARERKFLSCPKYFCCCHCLTISFYRASFSRDFSGWILMQMFCHKCRMKTLLYDLHVF